LLIFYNQVHFYVGLILDP